MTRPKPAAAKPAAVVSEPFVAEARDLFEVSAACLRYCARLIHDDATVTGEAGREVCAEMVALAAHMKALADALPVVSEES